MEGHLKICWGRAYLISHHRSDGYNSRGGRDENWLENKTDGEP